MTLSACWKDPFAPPHHCCRLGACMTGRSGALARWAHADRAFFLFFHARWAHAWLPFSFLIFFIIFVQHIFQSVVYHHFFQYLYNIFYNMSTTFFQQIHKHFFNKPTAYSSPLPETGCLLSVRMFTECILSGTWQRSSLPSAVKKTLGKIIALDKRGKKHSAKFGTRQMRKKTLGKK